MKESIMQLITAPKGKQKCIKIDYIELKDHKGEYLEFPSSSYEMEYFDNNEKPLPDGHYPYLMFEQVIIAAPVVRFGDPTPIITYRGFKLKKEFRKYHDNKI